MAQETGKQRAARIPLDYFKRTDRIQRVKLWLTGLAVLAAVGWWAGSLVRSDQGRMLYSRGPVVNAHAMWDAECNACHTNFQPINGSVGLSQWIGHAGDEKCSTCHAGPPHSSRQLAADVKTCAGCHRDHQGRDFLLTRVGDGDCTSCHRDLAGHIQKQYLPPQYANVTAFNAKGHPEFKALRDKQGDPGRLKFNHQQHMTAGQVLTPEGRPWTLGDITDLGERERYRMQQPPGQRNDNSPVTLSCASCHVLDSGDSGATRDLLAGLPVDALLPPRAAGAYMQPIVYENQCRACHPLTTEKGDGKTPPLTVPHRLQPDQVRTFLENSFIARYADNNPGFLNAPFQPPRMIPGKPVEPAKPTAEQEAAKTWVAGQVLNAERSLFLGKQTCGECHTYDSKTPVGPEAFQLNKKLDFMIQRPNVPTVWYQHARFDHAAHRAVDCRDCHGAAYPDSPNASRNASDVMVPGIVNCLQCHGPQSHSDGKLQGGARFDCVECHRYHHGDAPLQGTGADARGVQKRLNIQQFLRGGTK